MAAKKMKLETISHIHYETFQSRVEGFIEKITNPETMQIQFEVKEYPSVGVTKNYSFWAFILFDGELTK